MQLNDNYNNQTQLVLNVSVSTDDGEWIRAAWVV